MRSICLGLAILVSSAFGAYAQVTNTSTVGGQGGSPFDDPCHGTDVLIGFNFTDGDALNTVAAVCQAQNNGVLVGANYGLATRGTGPDDTSHAFPARFGPAPETPRCPSGSAVISVDVWVNKFNEIDSVEGHCAQMTPADPGARFTLSQSQSQGRAVGNAIPVQCPDSMMAVGITGRSGDLMDSLGLKCSPFPWHVLAAPPPLPSQFQSLTVNQPDDYYDQISGNKKGTLNPGTANVGILAKGAPDNPGWYEITWPGAGAVYWIYTGDGCPCLTIPTYWQ
jgi:hypothetical protein